MERKMERKRMPQFYLISDRRERRSVFDIVFWVYMVPY
jgi:hypothetical protein